MSFYPPIPWNTQFFHMAARISILSDLQIILNILKHILQNAVGAKPIQFYHKPCETDGKHLYLNIQVTWGYTISNDDKKHSFDTLFFYFSSLIYTVYFFLATPTVLPRLPVVFVCCPLTLRLKNTKTAISDHTI